MRHLTPLAAAVVLAAALGACDEKPQGEAPSRFAGVARTAAAPAATTFCEKTWAPGQGPRLALPALRPLPGAAAPPKAAEGAWRWVNVWATWCVPCVEEMGLLSQWRDALGRDGLPLAFEMLSVDEPDAEAALGKFLERKLPGPVSWVRSTDDVAPWFESLGVSRDAAIPVHALFGPDGRLRCARVGALHAQDYGAVRALLQSAGPPPRP